jgi:hypothetical protein
MLIIAPYCIRVVDSDSHGQVAKLLSEISSMRVIASRSHPSQGHGNRSLSLASKYLTRDIVRSEPEHSSLPSLISRILSLIATSLRHVGVPCIRHKQIPRGVIGQGPDNILSFYKPNRFWPHGRMICQGFVTVVLAFALPFQSYLVRRLGSYNGKGNFRKIASQCLRNKF